MTIHLSRTRPTAAGAAEGGAVAALEPGLRSLLQTYVTYLSGCEPCTRASLREALALDEPEARLQRLATWRRAPARTYTEREAIALVWAEVVVVSGEHGIGEPLRREAAELFTASELAELTRAVTSARGWSRLLQGPPRGRTGRRRTGPCRGPTDGECGLRS